MGFLMLVWVLYGVLSGVVCKKWESGARIIPCWKGTKALIYNRTQIRLHQCVRTSVRWVRCQKRCFFRYYANTASPLVPVLPICKYPIWRRIKEDVQMWSLINIKLIKRWNNPLSTGIIKKEMSPEYCSCLLSWIASAVLHCRLRFFWLLLFLSIWQAAALVAVRIIGQRKQYHY